MLLEELKNRIDKERIPSHIAVIMDGNGRWAERQGVKRLFGHQNAIEAVRNAAEGSAELGVHYLTLYAFSTENWARPKYEVEGLMSLLVNTISKEVPTLQKNNIRLSTIGDISKLPANAQEKLDWALEATGKNTGMTLILALNYSGRWDIMQAVNELVKAGASDVPIGDFEKKLSTAGIPDPDLLIRTSGEMRISNFLLWQLAYSELFFTEVLWPDFRKKDLYEAIISYQHRERRFGKTSDQVNT